MVIIALIESEKGAVVAREMGRKMFLGEFREQFVFNSKFLLYICSL